MNRNWNTNWRKSIIVLSGGFDPVHKGHLRMFREASWLGHQVIVGLNSDDWLTRKKGKPFMNFGERKEILEAFRYINQVLPFDDSDDTGCGAIEKVKELYKDKFGGQFHKKLIFCNGGDRTAENIPEMERYKGDEWVSFEFGVGGENKINSSSWILEDY